MIRGLHGLFYSSEPDATRAFIRDKLKLPYTDVGEGWLIFDLPVGDVGVHPTHPDGPASGTHSVSFFCDDIHGTVAELKSRGVVFDQDVFDAGFGFVTSFTMPGGVEIELYEPKYQKRALRPKPSAEPSRRARPKGARKKSADRRRR